MHRSSENVAAIATALAKAQTELSNPEKAMIARSIIPEATASRTSATPRYRAVWISSERSLAVSKSRLRKQPTSTGPAARSISPRSSSTPQVNGSRRTGRSASYRKPQHPVGWGRR
jgi:hypothetical protein